MSKQIGPFSKAEITFLINSCKNHTIEEMAEHLNRSEDSIKKQLLSRGLYKEKTTAQLEEEVVIKQQLWSLAFWESIVNAYDDHEIVYFENNWVSFSKQFNLDMTYTECFHLKSLLQAEIEKNRIQSNQKDTRGRISTIKDKLRKLQIGEEAQTLTPVEQMEMVQLKSELALMEGAASGHVTNLEKLGREIAELTKKLKGDRENRRQVETSADTYWGYVALLQDESYRQDETYKAELGRLAQKKAKDDLQSLTPFVDGAVDYPMLNAETMDKIKEQEEQEGEDIDVS
jgi:hypothetical protein